MSGMGVTCLISGWTGEPSSTGVGSGSPDLWVMSAGSLPSGNRLKGCCAVLDAGIPAPDGVPMSGPVREPAERVGRRDVGPCAPVIEPSALPRWQVRVGAGAGHHGLENHGCSDP